MGASINIEADSEEGRNKKTSNGKRKYEETAEGHKRLRSVSRFENQAGSEVTHGSESLTIRNENHRIGGKVEGKRRLGKPKTRL